MFELADHLVGIYNTDNCTNSVTINYKKLNLGGQSSLKTQKKMRVVLCSSSKEEVMLSLIFKITKNIHKSKINNYYDVSCPCFYAF